MTSIHPSRLKRKVLCQVMDFDKDLIDCQQETLKVEGILWDLNPMTKTQWTDSNTKQIH